MILQVSLKDPFDDRLRGYSFFGRDSRRLFVFVGYYGGVDSSYPNFFEVLSPRITGEEPKLICVRN